MDRRTRNRAADRRDRGPRRRRRRAQPAQPVHHQRRVQARQRARSCPPRNHGRHPTTNGLGSRHSAYAANQVIAGLANGSSRSSRTTSQPVATHAPASTSSHPPASDSAQRSHEPATANAQRSTTTNENDSPHSVSSLAKTARSSALFDATPAAPRPTWSTTASATAAGVAPPDGAMAHALRHTYGMDLAMRGVPLSVI